MVRSSHGLDVVWSKVRLANVQHVSIHSFCIMSTALIGNGTSQDTLSGQRERMISAEGLESEGNDLL